jgi:hypothetical protein
VMIRTRIAAEASQILGNQGYFPRAHHGTVCRRRTEASTTRHESRELENVSSPETLVN